jgi:GTP-binding protein
VELKIQQADFLTSATEKEAFPPEDMAEMAFAGRSNVGKSSLINALCHRKKLVRVSNTPGRTRTLNFFTVTLQRSVQRPFQLRLCDMPGYGYAKVSKAERKDWEAFIEVYLLNRPQLKVVVQLVDGEVGPTELDLETMHWLQEMSHVPLIVATKMDRLGKAHRKPALHKHEAMLGVAKDSIIGVSAEEGLHLDVLWKALLGRLQDT